MVLTTPSFAAFRTASAEPLVGRLEFVAMAGVAVGLFGFASAERVLDELWVEDEDGG